MREGLDEASMRMEGIESRRWWQEKEAGREAQNKRGLEV